jgi:two-component system chemotaxis response regulator CheB
VPSSTLRVALVDTRDDRRTLMRHVVDGDGKRASVVAEAESRDAALLVVDQERADAVVLDIRMPVPEGLRTIRDLRRSFPRLGIVVCSFDLGPATVEHALGEGANTCLAKPASRQDLIAALEAACLSEPSSSVHIAATLAASAPRPMC